MKLNMKTLCAVGTLVFASTAVFGMNGALEESRSMSWSKRFHTAKIAVFGMNGVPEKDRLVPWSKRFYRKGHEPMSWLEMSKLALNDFNRKVYAKEVNEFFEKRSDICNKFVNLFDKGTGLLVDEIHRQIDAYGSVDALLKEHFDDWHNFWNPIIRMYYTERFLTNLLRIGESKNFNLINFLYSETTLKQLDADRKLEANFYIDLPVEIDKLNNKINILIRDIEASRSRMDADESIESAVRMFEEAESEVTENEAIKSAVRMFEEAESEAAEAASQVVARELYYSKFGQFFKSMWSRFVESRLGRTLNLVRSYFFQH